MKKKEKQSERKKQQLQRELKAMEEKYGGTLNWLERGELHSWVDAGNSPLTNPEDVIHVDGSPFDFIEWHRSARWVTVMEPFPAGPSGRELFDFYTDRDADHGSLEETRKYLRDAQTFLGCEILALTEFLKEKGLLYEYLCHNGSADHAEEELPFL